MKATFVGLVFWLLLLILPIAYYGMWVGSSWVGIRKDDAMQRLGLDNPSGKFTPLCVCVCVCVCVCLCVTTPVPVG
jgi:hypothetical protein